MTQEEKFKEAKRLYETANADQRYVLESLFPELKESEDERIRKELIKETKGSEVRLFETVTNDEFVDWLERQEQKSFGFNNGDTIDHNLNDYCCKIYSALHKENGGVLSFARLQHLAMDIYGWCKEQDEQKPAAWSEEDESMLNDITHNIHFAETHRKVTGSSAMEKEQVDWLKSLKDRVQQQSQWSEEDNRMCKAIIDNIKAICKEGYFVGNIGSDKLINWLKSLILKNSHAYNPYKTVVESIAEMCKHYDKASHSDLRDFYDNVKVKCKDAKEYNSLYPQSQWKPSEQDILLLERIFNGKLDPRDFQASLLSIIEQLKKLKEE